MGRPKAKEKAEPRQRTTIINLKGTEEQAAWLEAVHKKTRWTKTTIIRMALEDWASKHGHAPFPADPEG